MNWVDLAIIASLAIFTFEGFGRSFLGESLDLASFLGAFLSSLRFYNLASRFLENQFGIPRSIANVLGFMAIWFVVESILFLLVRFWIVRQKTLYQASKRIDGLAPVASFLRGMLFVSLTLLLVGAFPIQPQVKRAVDSSSIGSAILRNIQGLEAPFKSVFGGITQDTFSFLTIKPSSEESVNLGFTTNDFAPVPELEKKMIDMVNEERKKAGAPELEFDSRLAGVGRAHSGDMFRRGFFAHRSPENKNVADRSDGAGIKYLVVGENLAFAPSLALAHQGLMNSPGHKANILSLDYHKIGIGIMDGKTYGLMITQVFSN